ESSILYPSNANDFMKTQNDSTYLKFTSELNPQNINLAEIEMIVGLGKVEETSIDIEELKWYDQNGNLIDYDTEISNGNFKLLGVCYDGGGRFINPNSQAGLLSISPNPAENWIETEVSLGEIGNTDISI